MEVDIVKFVEKLIGHELSYWQKKYVEMVEKMPDDSRLVMARSGKGKVVND